MLINPFNKNELLISGDISDLNQPYNPQMSNDNENPAMPVAQTAQNIGNMSIYLQRGLHTYQITLNDLVGKLLLVSALFSFLFSKL